jgi:hypothetical protein
VVDKKTEKIICTAYAKGKNHDYKLFKESKTHILPSIKVQVDTGFQGLQKKHLLTDIPKKKNKKRPLSNAEKLENKRISRERVKVENVIRCPKIFRIIAEKYRNRRKRFGLRLNLIAAFYNRNIDLKIK